MVEFRRLIPPGKTCHNIPTTSSHEDGPGFNVSGTELMAAHCFDSTGFLHHATQLVPFTKDETQHDGRTRCVAFVVLSRTALGDPLSPNENRSALSNPIRLNLQENIEQACRITFQGEEPIDPRIHIAARYPRWPWYMQVCTKCTSLTM